MIPDSSQATGRICVWFLLAPLLMRGAPVPLLVLVREVYFVHIREAANPKGVL